MTKGTATIAHVIRWSDNTQELQRNLREANKQIAAMKRRMKKGARQQRRKRER